MTWERVARLVLLALGVAALFLIAHRLDDVAGQVSNLLLAR